MTALDPRYFEDALKFEASLNAEAPKHVQLVRTPNLPAGSAGAAVTAFHFILSFRHIGAATVPLTWLLALSEAMCAPLEGVELAYGSDGYVTAKCWYAKGWAVPAGFELFVDHLVESARIAPFEWAPDVIPHYSHLAARAVADLERFKRHGKLVRESLLASSAWIIPEVQCPCEHRDAELPGSDDLAGRRRWTAGILQALRTGRLK